MTKILVTARALLAVAEAASSDESRPILGGVLVRPDGSMIATDGHWMVHIPPAVVAPDEFPLQEPDSWYDVPEEGLLVPKKVILSAAAAIKPPPAGLVGQHVVIP